MDVTFLEGDLVRLSPIAADDDLSAYLRWVNDQETTRFMGSGRLPTTADGLRSYISSYAGRADGMLLAVHDVSTGAHVGNITLHSIDWRDRRGEIGILIGEPSARGKGFGAEALRLLVAHAFQRLGLNKLTAGYVEGNEPSARLFAGAGFVVEGVLKEHFFLDGMFRDCARVALLGSSWSETR